MLDMPNCTNRCLGKPKISFLDLFLAANTHQSCWNSSQIWKDTEGTMLVRKLGKDRGWGIFSIWNVCIHTAERSWVVFSQSYNQRVSAFLVWGPVRKWGINSPCKVKQYQFIPPRQKEIKITQGLWEWRGANKLFLNQNQTEQSLQKMTTVEDTRVGGEITNTWTLPEQPPGPSLQKPIYCQACVVMP